MRNQRAPGTLDRTADPVSGEYSRDFDINPFSYALNTSRTMSPDETYIMNYAPFNILNEARNNYIDLDMTDMKYQMELTYKPVKGLDLSAIGAFRYVKSTQEHKITGNSNLAQATVRREMRPSVKRTSSSIVTRITRMPCLKS